MAMPSSTLCGSLSKTLRSMNAPGSPSSALQMTYFCGAWRFGDRAPFQAGRISRAAATAQSALDHRVHHVLRRHFAKHVIQPLITVGGDVSFDAFRINFAAVRQNDGQLFFEKWAFGGRQL